MERLAMEATPHHSMLYNLADDPTEKRIALLIPINRFGFVAGSTKRTPIATRSDALGLP